MPDVMPETPTLETARFILRPLEPSDSAALFPAFSDPELMRWWSCAPFASPQELTDWLCDPTWDGRSWAAVPKAGGPAIGRFVATAKDQGMSEIGYLVIRDWQGQGAARECLTAVLDHLFLAEGQRRVFADVDPDNAASIALLKGLGFTMEGRLRDHWHTHIGVRDSLIWGLLAREWKVRHRL